MNYSLASLSYTFVALSLILSFSACNQEAPAGLAAAAPVDPSVAQAQALTAFLDAWNIHDASSIQDHLTADFQRYHNGKLQADGVAAMRAVMEASFLRNDASITLDHVHYSGNMAIVYWTYSGTNIGELADGTPATNKSFSNPGLTVVHFNDAAMITKSDVFTDNWSLFEQLGYTMMMPEGS